MKMDFSRAFSALFPANCLMCNAPCTGSLDLCQQCLDALPHIDRACYRCALPLPALNQPALNQPSTQQHSELCCGACQTKPPVFDRSVSLFEYKQDAAALIMQFKFKDRLVLARIFGQLMSERLRQCAGYSIDALLPVPLHGRRLRWRGFNQSIELSRIVAGQLHIPMLLDHVVRVRNTAQQTGLDANNRRKNIKGAFKVVRPIPPGDIAIIDDVVTTGSTANELARVLKKAGAKRVWVCSVARAPLADK